MGRPTDVHFVHSKFDSTRFVRRSQLIRIPRKVAGLCLIERNKSARLPRVGFGDVWSTSVRGLHIAPNQPAKQIQLTQPTPNQPTNQLPHPAYQSNPTSQPTNELIKQSGLPFAFGTSSYRLQELILTVFGHLYEDHGAGKALPKVAH